MTRPVPKRVWVLDDPDDSVGIGHMTGAGTATVMLGDDPFDGQLLAAPVAEYVALFLRTAVVMTSVLPRAERRVVESSFWRFRRIYVCDEGRCE